MKFPKIHSVKAIDEKNLLVVFDNQQKKKYDITPLLKKEMFQPLKNSSFFKQVKVDTGGYAVVWNNQLDISEYELWKNGKLV